MSMLVDVSYFISGPRQIRNATTAKMPTAEGLSANNVIYGYIRSFQRIFLNDVVGFTLAGQITDYLEIIENESPKTENDTVSPYEYVCRQLRESFADYVFYHILRDMNTDATVTGLIQLKSSNKHVSPLQRQVSTWNTMVERNKQFVCWASSDECPFKVNVNKNLLTPINSFNL